MDFNRKAKDELSPPYVGYPAHLEVLQRLRRQQGVPSDLAKNDAIRGPLTKGTYSQLLRAWRYLGFLNTDGKPEESLLQLIGADKKASQPILKGALESSYQFVFGPENEPLDLSSATFEDLRSRFTRRGVSGSTVRRSVFFFTRMARDAGISLSKELLEEKWSVQQEDSSMIGYANGTATVRGTLTASADTKMIESPHLRYSGPKGELLLMKLPEFNDAWSIVAQEDWLRSYGVILSIIEREKRSEA